MVNYIFSPHVLSNFSMSQPMVSKAFCYHTSRLAHHRCTLVMFHIWMTGSWLFPTDEMLVDNQHGI